MRRYGWLLLLLLGGCKSTPTQPAFPESDYQNLVGTWTGSRTYSQVQGGGAHNFDLHDRATNWQPAGDCDTCQTNLGLLSGTVITYDGSHFVFDETRTLYPGIPSPSHVQVRCWGQFDAGKMFLHVLESGGCNCSGELVDTLIKTS